MPDDDRDLYESFAAVRREEEARVPPISTFSLTACGQGRRRLSGKLIAATMCLASLIAVAVWLLPEDHVEREGSNHGREQPEFSITSWKPATDFLLDTPGRELLEDVPSIGEWHGAIMPGPGESHRPFRKRVVR